MLEIKLDQMLSEKQSLEGIAKQIRSGAIFIYPTDTVYGLGCNAEDARAVKKLRKIKGTEHPFSVIAPSLKWISENLETGLQDYLKQLPGPVTLIMRKKRLILDAASNDYKLGVRMPDHPITKLIECAGVPFITTSANRSEQPPIKNVREISKDLEREVDFVIDGGQPSRVIDISGSAPVVLRE
jgi:L-threonylcarbamoyladenylate synthase